MATESLGRGRTHPLPGLRRIMEERRLSNRQLGLLSDVHYATISRIVKGAAANRDTTKRLARALKVTPEELMAEPAEQPATVSPLEIGQPGAGELEDEYIDHFAGGEDVDPMYEEELADAYLRMVRAEGATDAAIKRAIRRALVLGKTRGKQLS